jgi:hypothetical protein
VTRSASQPPTPDELIGYMVSLVGLENLEEVFGLMTADEVREVCRIAMMPLPLHRVDVVRSALLRDVAPIAERSKGPDRPNGWLA